MICVGVCLFLLFVIVLLVCFYHLYYWNEVDLGMSKFSRVWVSPFECGFLGLYLVEKVFSYTYFILLVFFVMFDLEVSLLLKIPYQGVLFDNFFYYYFFVFVLCLGYFFEVSKGYVSWKY